MSSLQPKSELANLPEVTELCKYALFTDYIELDESNKEIPVSVIIVADVGNAKTAVVKQYADNDGLLYIDNVTAWGLQKVYLRRIVDGVIRRIIIPDFIDPTNRKKATVDSTITFFNKIVSWEGLKEIQTYAMSVSLEKPVHCSLLTTMALQDYRRMVKGLAAVGFLSRLLLIAYRYSESQINDLLEDIVYKRATWHKIELSFPQHEVPIALDPDLAVTMMGLARTLGNRAGDNTGSRAYNQLAMLAKGRALSKNRPNVNEDDISRIMYLAERYVNNVKLGSE